ncbi:NAD(P)/FAD-dependent oxidoreductase [Amycolatopsis sp. cg9]|uniref:NAD(P)/FAD-dependent oxidoreductase n=1 Tax=Amycolatopsis sp. cg9 TaxID=3238801 RepID=UPI003524331A
MNAAVEATRTFDAIVVGNGALGQSLALVLARRGVRVALLGEPHRPFAASAAAGAMLGCFGEVTETLVSSDHGRAKLDLDVQAAKLWPEWAAELADDPAENVHTADGTVVILNAIGVPGIDDANYSAMRAELRRYEEPHEDVDPGEIDWLDPDPGARPLRAMFIPGEHAVNAAALLSQLQRAFLRAGGTVIAEQAARVVHSGGRATGVVLDSGTELSAAHVVLAAGARSQDVLETVPEIAAQVPPLVSGYGLSVLLRPPDKSGPRSVIRTPNRAFACGLHVVPRATGEVYVGATNIVSATPVDTPVVRDVHFLLDCVHRQVRRDLYGADILKVQVGNRPIALDGFPLLGEAGLAGLWLMTGTYRDGLHLSPLLAKEMAARILGETAELDLDAFRPLRKPIQTATREEIVATTTTHLLATGYECDWYTPTFWPQLIEKNLPALLTAVAEDIHPTRTPPPELLDEARTDPTLRKLLQEYYAACD